jgi:hypothetical protein
MPVLRIGAQDIAYTKGGETTGDVGDILEAKYHVVEHFFEAHGQEIVDEYTASMVASMEDLLSGRTPSADPFRDAASTTYDLFQKFIDSREMDALGYPGIPTKASLEGVNHRLKHPNARGNPSRPSFKDTGAWEQAFATEIEV